MPKDFTTLGDIIAETGRSSTRCATHTHRPLQSATICSSDATRSRSGDRRLAEHHTRAAHRYLNAAAFAACLRPLRATPWVVFAKRPFGGPEQVLDYLGRYTHRVAITNRRLVSLHETRVSFLWKDYRHHDKRKVMTLDAEGSSAASCFTSCPTASTASVTTATWPTASVPPSWPCASPASALRIAAMAGDYRERYHQLTGRSLELCPCCGGRMVQIALIPRPATPRRLASLDTS